MRICSGRTFTTSRTGSSPTHTSCIRIRYTGAGTLRRSQTSPATCDSMHTRNVICRQPPLLLCTLQAHSVHMWVNASMGGEEGRVFHYQMPTADRHFVLGLSSPHMLQQAAQLAHGRPLFMDATFGMNDHKARSLRSVALRDICCAVLCIAAAPMMTTSRRLTVTSVRAVFAVHHGGDGRARQCAAGRLLPD